MDGMFQSNDPDLEATETVPVALATIKQMLNEHDRRFDGMIRQICKIRMPTAGIYQLPTYSICISTSHLGVGKQGQRISLRQQIQGSTQL